MLLTNMSLSGLLVLTMNGILHALIRLFLGTYEGWNFNSGNYLFTTDTK